MTQSLRLQFTPNQKDYASVLRLFFWQRTSTKISLIILLIAFAMIVFVIATQGTPPSIFEVIWLLLPLLFIFFVFFIQPSSMAKRAIKNEQLVAETTWEVSDAGVAVSSKHGSTQHAWADFKQLVTTKEYFLMLYKSNPNSFRFLPRRAFASPEDEARFVDLVNESIARAKS